MSSVGIRLRRATRLDKADNWCANYDDLLILRRTLNDKWGIDLAGCATIDRILELLDTHGKLVFDEEE